MNALLAVRLETTVLQKENLKKKEQKDQNFPGMSKKTGTLSHKETQISIKINLE